MPRLNEAERLHAVVMLEAGMTQVDIAMRLGVHFNTVYRLWIRYQQSNSSPFRSSAYDVTPAGQLYSDYAFAKPFSTCLCNI